MSGQTLRPTEDVAIGELRLLVGFVLIRIEQAVEQVVPFLFDLCRPAILHHLFQVRLSCRHDSHRDQLVMGLNGGFLTYLEFCVSTGEFSHPRRADGEEPRGEDHLQEEIVRDFVQRILHTPRSAHSACLPTHRAP